MQKNQERKRLTQLHVYIDPDILGQLKRLARREGRVVSELVREGVAKILRERGNKARG